MSATEWDFPRPLSPRETEVLRFLLSADDPRLEALRQQADTAQAVGRCDCGCATIDLAVDAGMPAADGLGSPAIQSESREGFSDPDWYRELLLFLENGRLSSLEIVDYGDVVPDEFPPIGGFNDPRIRS